MLYLNSLISKRPKLSMKDKCLRVGMAVCDLTFLQASRYESSCLYYTLNIERLNSINKQRKGFDDPSICKLHVNMQFLLTEKHCRLKIMSDHFRYRAGDSYFTSFVISSRKEIQNLGL